MQRALGRTHRFERERDELAVDDAERLPERGLLRVHVEEARQ
jgi:hypothetical protein